MDENRITYFAETDARNKRVRFGIKAKDRTRHVYVLGKTGMGKSTLLENMAVQDIQNGEGMCFIDPHGKTADLLMEYVPEKRIRDVIYIAPFDTEYPISFNVLESVDPDKRHLVVSGLMSTFKKIWVDAWSARMEYILTNTLLALLEAPGSTLLGVNRMLSDKAYRNEIVSHVKDPSVKAFWTKEFANYTERQAAEAVPAIQNKVGQFTANPLIRNMIGQPTSSFDFREAMDKRKIMIINLSKGKIGDENMKLLGGLLVTKIYLAAMSRADIPDRVMKIMPNFYLYVDEFQNFANASFADILSEARKYKLNLTIAHQYVEQMDEIVRPAVFGNVGTMIVFRVGASDAEILEKEFMPQFTTEDLVNLGFAQIYLKLMIDGLSSAPFSAVTMLPIPHPDTSYVKEIIAASREQFAKPRADVEAEIVKFHEPTPVPRPAPKAASPAAIAPAAAAASAAPSVPAASAVAPAKPQTAPVARPAAPTALPKAAPAAAPIPAMPPKAAPSAPRAPAPADKPVHQPFKAALADVLKQAQAPKPVSLSALAPKPSGAAPAAKPPSRPDPKIPTPENVSQLKSALQSILAKNAAAKPMPAASSPAPAPTPAPAGLKPVPKADPQQREVPEEVLKKVLKVD
ncbi:MAG: type IV secretion system DNA-binding domain-containing protein [Patescibacteria group bacterium]|nr:type IV secretion system DNA-binding domain-containing protein [Patescibacteria group bacterium]